MGGKMTRNGKEWCWYFDNDGVVRVTVRDRITSEDILQGVGEPLSSFSHEDVQALFGLTLRERDIAIRAMTYEDRRQVRDLAAAWRPGQACDRHRASPNREEPETLDKALKDDQGHYLGIDLSGDEETG